MGLRISLSAAIKKPLPPATQLNEPTELQFAVVTTVPEAGASASAFKKRPDHEPDS